MSIRLSLQTMIMADKVAQQLVSENNELQKALLVERLYAKIQNNEVAPDQMLEPKHVCQVVANTFFKLQSRIRKRCEKQGDLFRPQMLIPIATGILTRFGTGGIAALVGYQKETNKKLKGANSIIERVRKVNEFCNETIEPLVENPGWTIAKVRIEKFGYQWRDADNEPFSIIWDDDLESDDDDDSGDQD